uniref:S1-like domain-containing protein n=1 Tax=viral metagenome TaxID=1070528 RepID=A0A6C0EJK5_9ZZZZ
MVKNIHGGNKHKKFARKRDETGKNNIASLKKTPGQEYGYITKMLGSCRFDIICYDKKQRIGHVRGKLRQRTWFVVGDLVLLSLRDFQDGMCDMIQKYQYDDVNILINNNEVNESFGKHGTFFETKTDDSQVNVSFTNPMDLNLSDAEAGGEEVKAEATVKKPVSNVNYEEEIDICDLMNL